MFATTLAVLAAISLPSFDGKDAAYIVERMPSSIDREGKVVAAQVIFLISEKGKVEDCEIEAFIGEEELASRICEITENRTIGKATDTNGRPMASVLRTVVIARPNGVRIDFKKASQILNDKAGRPMGIDMVIDSGEPLRNGKAALILAINEQGLVQSCEAEDDTIAREREQELCAAASRRTHRVYRTADGGTKRYATMFYVGFDGAGSKD